jgi:hypothetical protein
MLKGGLLSQELTPVDNAGLGMARAAAVAREIIIDGRLSKFRILPLSGAQAITNEEWISVGNIQTAIPERRRIEIRVRRYIPNNSKQR